MTITCNGKIINLSTPLVMGILNVTPDSFFDGGKYTNSEAIEQRVKQIVNEGAAIIDLGAYSSRPGAADVSENEEIKRLSSALEIIRKFYPEIIVSVDTFRANVAKFAVENFKTDIVNDIYAGKGDQKMFETIAKHNVPYVMMHMLGTPQTMQNNPTYQNVINEIIFFFSEKIKQTSLLGIKDVIIDPGFGFGKTIDHNYQIMEKLEDFKFFEKPLLVGVSRKSMIYKFLNITPDQTLPGTLALNTIAILKGANILRVHDVAETVQALKIIQKMNLIKQFDN